jgi:DNA-binding XRE family transcriptional regulator
MSDRITGNYLRAHRRKSGLTQRELGRLLGYSGKGPIPRHEQARSVPPFLTALAYESVFQVPVSAIFTGFHSTVSANILSNLRQFEADLDRLNGERRLSALMQQKRQWLKERLRAER